MPPRRPRSTSNVSASNIHIARAPTASPKLKKQFALAQDSIYQNNLNVIKRRDPSVVSILDQFSHICLYNFNGKTGKWVREGYEGSIFIVEHRDTPNYGFYILNRLGTGDYSRRIYPEDDVEILGNYLMYRYYREFTAKRIAMNLPYPLPPQIRPMFDHEFAKDHSLPDESESSADSDAQQPYRAKKGTSFTLGIWQFPQSDRVETLKDVMLRLHECVKHGQPYPELYRYGPGRPPPPQPPHPQPEHGSASPNGHGQVFGQPIRPGVVMNAAQTQGAIEGANGVNGAIGVSEVDKLFAKLQPSPTTMAAASAAAAPSSGSVQNWFAALTGQDFTQPPSHISPAITPAQSIQSVSQATPTRGMALLDSIFASVSQPAELHQTVPSPYPAPGHPMPQQPRLPPQPEEIQIVSPKPQSSQLPQILTQNVISTLLGLGPNSASSRASSAALSSNSSHRSVNKRYEGDNELSENDGVSEADISASTTMFDAVSDPAILVRGNSHLGVPSTGYSGFNGSFGIQGDVTPRAPARGIGSTSPTLNGHRSEPSVLSLSSLMSAASVSDPSAVQPPEPSSTPNRHPTASSASQRAQSLVPFTADSELWPYPRAPLNEHELSSDADVVELDFSDTRALSDPSLFQAKQTKQGKNERKRKSRKEKAADKQRDREAIENGWDDPMKGQVTINGVQTNGNAQPQALSVEVLLQSAQEQQVNGHVVPVANGSVSDHSTVQLNGRGVASDSPADVAREAILNVLSTHPKAPARDISRKQFVQEMLDLIYRDNSFMDKLYTEYTGSAS